MTKSGDVTIALTSDEALVLFGLLPGWEDAGRVSAPRHQGEQVALWKLSACWSANFKSRSMPSTTTS